MTAVWLIAANFVREQRWFILLMVTYITGITALLALVEKHDADSLIVFKQEAGYGLFFAVVIAAAVFQNERKTRRIIAVLSKAVARREYVAGVIVGVTLTVATFYAAVFASLFVLFPRADFGAAALMIATMMVASLLASVVTVLYATFLHPLAATAAAGLTLAAPFVLEQYIGEGWARVLPIAALVRTALAFSPERGTRFDGAAITIALAECAALWIVASWIFSLRDITTPVE
jgi:ABC-type transport system involved in multi-copper enzyme maturation permease subunit